MAHISTSLLLLLVLTCFVAAFENIPFRSHCEVFDKSMDYSFDLPNNILIQPVEKYWSFDISLYLEIQEKYCINVMYSISGVAFVLTQDHCSGPLLDQANIQYDLMPSMWTSIKIKILSNAVEIGYGEKTVQLTNLGLSEILNVRIMNIKNMKGVKLAISCKNACPHTAYSVKNREILNTQLQQVSFYLYLTMNTTVAIKALFTSSLGKIYNKHVEEIESANKWMFMTLNVTDTKIIIYTGESKSVKILPKQMFFKRYVVEVAEGIALATFSCNPISGKMLWFSNLQQVESCNKDCNVENMMLIILMFVIVNMFCVVGFFIYYIIKRKRKLFDCKLFKVEFNETLNDEVITLK
ncbi:hypothetical protein CsNV_048 [Callinectes sapidus nudivirus]|nr:hypothetical protein CsNV_048 [Callinectes sapidus nudivirus]